MHCCSQLRRRRTVGSRQRRQRFRDALFRHRPGDRRRRRRCRRVAGNNHDWICCPANLRDRPCDGRCGGQCRFPDRQSKRWYRCRVLWRGGGRRRRGRKCGRPDRFLWRFADDYRFLLGPVDHRTGDQRWRRRIRQNNRAVAGRTVTRLQQRLGNQQEPELSLSQRPGPVHLAVGDTGPGGCDFLIFSNSTNG